MLRTQTTNGNPPFGGMEEDGIESNYPAEFRTRETADLFLVLLRGTGEGNWGHTIF